MRPGRREDPYMYGAHRRGPTAGLVFGLLIISLVVLALAAGVVVTVLRTRTAPASPETTVAEPGFFSSEGALGQIAQQILPGQSNAPSLAPWAGTERTNILVVGIDQRPKEDPNTTRTDTMILVTLDPVGKSAGMLSIPRDLYVPIPGHGSDRINAAHVFGGSKLAMQTVSYNFGLPVQHYVRVNFGMVTTVIDMLGGVEVFNEQDIADYSYPDMNYGYDPFFLKAGWQRLDGKTALKYMRTRHGASDFMRMKRQQQVIMALRDKALSTDAITKLLPQAGAIYQSMRDSIQTDLSLTDLLRMALFAKDLPSERITRVAVDETATQAWTTPSGAQVLIPVRERVRELRDELYTPAPAAVAKATPEPGRVILQNGTQVKGLAGQTQQLLINRGFTVLRVENAPINAGKTVIVDYHGRQQFTRQLALVLGVPVTAIQTKLDATNPADALIILGDDFELKP